MELKKARAGEPWGGAPSDKAGGEPESSPGRLTFQWKPEGGESSRPRREQQVQRLRGWEELPLPTPQERPGVLGAAEVGWDR